MVGVGVGISRTESKWENILLWSQLTSYLLWLACRILDVLARCGDYTGLCRTISSAPLDRCHLVKSGWNRCYSPCGVKHLIKKRGPQDRRSILV